jgi:hypothetical protein
MLKKTLPPNEPILSSFRFHLSFPSDGPCSYYKQEANSFWLKW